jgi:hypothetical protein
MQPVQVGLEILFREEARLTVVAAPHDVQRNIVEQDARAAGLGGRLRRG